MTLIVGGMFLIGVIALPILRAAALMLTGVLAAVRMIEGWGYMRGLGAEPDRPLFLEGLSPDLQKLVRQTRFLNLELRRYTQQSPTWPNNGADTQTWWSAWVSQGGFRPHTDATREVWEWVRAFDLLPETARTRLEGLGVRAQPVRDLLAADLDRGAQVRALTGLVSSIDERLADLQPTGYRGNNASTNTPKVGQLPMAGDAEDDDNDDVRRRRWREVVTKHRPGISRLAASHARNPADREDLEQDISLALWQALPEFRGDSSLRTFVYRIARYCCFRLLRRRGRVAVSTLCEEVDDPSACLDTMLTRADNHNRLSQALRRLPEGPRATLALRLKGKSYAEIAETLGISERNVSVRLVRARQRISAEIQGAA